MTQASATVARLDATATVRVEVRPLDGGSFAVLDLDSKSRVQTTTTFKAPAPITDGYGAAACDGIRYATRLAGREHAVAVLSISGSNLCFFDADEAIAHAAMYAAWKALSFSFSSVEINVNPDWVLQ